jgi:hypothetical protein
LCSEFVTNTECTSTPSSKISDGTCLWIKVLLFFYYHIKIKTITIK